MMNNTATSTFYTHHASPIGPLLLKATTKGLAGLHMTSHRHGPLEKDGNIPAHWQADPTRFDTARQQLDEYFNGQRHSFDLPLDMAGTQFQQQVWRALCDIPYGETISYGELARRIHNPKAVRAVGLANGRNPVSIIVPCHRVIGSNGALTGYGGGIERKKFLLGLEGGKGLLV